MPTPVVGLLHPGQMGAAVGAMARRNGARVLWHPADRGAATAGRAEQAGLEPVAELSTLLGEANVVISVCPPAAAEDVAGQVAEHGFTGMYVEANAINPARTARIADLLTPHGARMVDGGIIGPPPSDDHPSRIYLSGAAEDIAVVEGIFAGTALHTARVDERLGSASALKMAFGGFQKASRALAAVSHALAAEYGVAELLRAEGERIERSPLADVDWLPGVVARAWRWGPEMNEFGDTLADLDLPPDLGRAAATVFGHWSDGKDDPGVSIADSLAALRTGRTGDAA